MYARVVSFNRPYDPSTQNLWDFELPLVRFLEEHGYDVSYTTDVDTDRDPGELLSHRLVVASGHDEYWTSRIRDAFEHALALGTNLAFTGADTGYWQMRYQDDRRTIVEYRIGSLDPQPDPASKTIRFRSLTPPRPECELEGVQYSEGADGEPESVGGPFAYSVNPAALNDPWLAGTGFTPDSVLPKLVGYEWDAVTPGCRTPPLTVFFTYAGPPVADAVRYTAPSGARVFSAGSLNFSHGLNDFQPHPTVPASGDPRLERFMENALADLARPAPPTSVRATRLGRSVRVTTRRHPDPRITTILVYRGRTLLCTHPTTTCADHHPPADTRLRYTVVLQDPWAHSAPTSSNPVTIHPTPRRKSHRDAARERRTGRAPSG
jgi:N,N-dimethylformamidase beta subunit-like, C-terminal